MPLRLGSDIPALTGATEWINGEPTEHAGPKLVHFWSVSCHICKENMPLLRDLKAKYEGQGLQFTAIHMPRQEEDTDVPRIHELVTSLGLDEPVGVDNKRAVADAFENEWVPAYFLYDAEGKLKFRAAGHHGVKMMTTAIERMFPAE